MSTLHERDGHEPRHACGHLQQFDPGGALLPCAIHWTRGGRYYVVVPPSAMSVPTFGASKPLETGFMQRLYERAKPLGVPVWRFVGVA